jgi:hypothetical protein
MQHRLLLLLVAATCAFGCDYTGRKCDIQQQDCPSGWKCTYAVHVSDTLADYAPLPGCVPAGPVNEGGTCTSKVLRNNSTDGDVIGDDCAVGLKCHYQSDGVTRCSPLCVTSASCRAGELCDYACFTPCAVFGSDCLGGQVCAEFDLSRFTGSFVQVFGPTCRPSGGTVPFYGPCSHASDCVDGATCIGPSCLPFCDDNHPCPNDSNGPVMCRLASRLTGVSVCGWPFPGPG